MSIVKILENEKQKLQCIITEIEKNRLSAPEGSIVLNYKEKKYLYFYLLFPGKKKKYLSKADDKLIRRLLQKRYDETVFKAVQKELQTINQFLDNYNSLAVEEQYMQIDENCREMIEVYRYPKEEYAKIWLSKKYKGNPYPIDNAFITARGEKVRSKSEVMIADCLTQEGLPYRYEYPIYIDDKVFYPDFLILQRNNGKEIIWEHFGKMDSDSYRKTAFQKIDVYATSGITVGHGLVFTMEDFRNPLNMSTVRKIVKAIKKESEI